MIVISAPSRLKVAVGSLFLSVPLLILEVIMVRQLPWWSLPYHYTISWASTLVLVLSFLSYHLLKARKWAFHLAQSLAALWIFWSIWLTCRLQIPALGFFSAFLLFFWSIVLIQLKTEMRKAFFDPQLPWYQSLPKPIPGLICEMSSGSLRMKVRVSRIDQNGAFIFSYDNQRKQRIHDWGQLSGCKKIDLCFHFRNQMISCSGIPTLLLSRAQGLGVQFGKRSLDSKKEISDFIEALRVEGYL